MNHEIKGTKICSPIDLRFHSPMPLKGLINWKNRPNNTYSCIVKHIIKSNTHRNCDKKKLKLLT